MTDKNENQWVAELARDLISQTAPQELPLFRANSEAFFTNPEKLLAGQKGKDEMLGFGVGEAVAMMTPTVLAVTGEVVKFLMEELKKTAKDESTALVGETVKKMFKKFRPEEKKENSPAPLTPEQLAQVRELALKKARHLKLSDARCKLLADALVGSLAVASV